MEFLSSDDIKKIGKPLFLDSNGTPVFVGDTCKQRFEFNSGHSIEYDPFIVEFSSFLDNDTFEIEDCQLIGFLLPTNMMTLTKC